MYIFLIGFSQLRVLDGSEGNWEGVFSIRANFEREVSESWEFEEKFYGFLGVWKK